MFKQDKLVNGMLVAVLSPLVLFLLFYGIFIVIQALGDFQPFITVKGLILLAIAPNFILVRLFHYRWKLHETSRGLLLGTLFSVILFFLLVQRLDLTLPFLLR